MMDLLKETGANNNCRFEIVLPRWEEPRDAIGLCRIVPPRDMCVITCFCFSGLNLECPSTYQLQRVKQQLPTVATV